jgi:hypothetical protein
MLKKKFVFFLFVSIFFLFATNFFNFVFWNYTFGGISIKIIILIILFYLVINNRNINTFRLRQIGVSRKYILFISLFPFVSAIPCLLFRNQSLFNSINATLPFLIILMYFIFHQKKPSEKELFNLLLFFSLFRIIIIILQQFTYPVYLFGGILEGQISVYGYEYQVENRSGFYRFWISAYYLSWLCGLYILNQYLKSRKIKYGVLYTILLAGIYIEQARYPLFVFVLCSFIMVLATKMKRKQKAFIYTLLFVLVGVVILNLNELFGKMIELTQNDISNEDFVRVIGYKYFTFDYWKGPFTFLFGNGIPNNSSYYNEIQNLGYQQKLFREDVGIIGTLNIFGLIFVLVFVLYLINTVFKNWRYIDNYLKMYIIFILIFSPMYFPINYTVGDNLFWAIIFYLIDISIFKNKSKFTVQLISTEQILETKKYNEQI